MRHKTRGSNLVESWFSYWSKNTLSCRSKVQVHPKSTRYSVIKPREWLWGEVTVRRDCRQNVPRWSFVMWSMFSLAHSQMKIRNREMSLPVSWAAVHFEKEELFWEMADKEIKTEVLWSLGFTLFWALSKIGRTGIRWLGPQHMRNALPL
jgi:hypothetical protein